jgi:hypothetical protein
MLEEDQKFGHNEAGHTRFARLRALRAFRTPAAPDELLFLSAVMLISLARSENVAFKCVSGQRTMSNVFRLTRGSSPARSAALLRVPLWA